MSTTHIQPLPNVRGRMSYTELGEGKKRTRNIREKTDRIAAQMGDMGTREDFIRFCSAMRRQSQGTRLNEGYELRVSWSPEELSKDSPEDIQRACEYGYALCKEVAPNAPCWVTVHTDGEGGCVHVHATIANHDLVSGTAIAHGTDHATVKRKNDRLSREMGFTVVGPEPAREPTTWAERKGQFGIESFERVLGNRVADARDHASNMEEFLEELKVRGVERTETRKVDEKTGEETVGWSYKSRDPYGKSRRKRRRRASNLADDLTREDEREKRLKSERMQRRVKDAEVGGQGHAVRRVAEKMRERRQAAPFLKLPLAGYEETFRRAVDGRTCKGRKIGVFVVRSFMSRIWKTRETDGAKRGREARLETGKSPDEDPIKPRKWQLNTYLSAHIIKYGNT